VRSEDTGRNAFFCNASAKNQKTLSTQLVSQQIALEMRVLSLPESEPLHHVHSLQLASYTPRRTKDQTRSVTREKDLDI